MKDSTVQAAIDHAQDGIGKHGEYCGSENTWARIQAVMQNLSDDHAKLDEPDGDAMFRSRVLQLAGVCLAGADSIDAAGESVSNGRKA